MTLDLKTEQLIAEAAEYMRTRFFGKYRGFVKEVDDPEKLGRIKAEVPEVYGDMESPWALPNPPYSGDGLGNYMIPPKGAGVWIEFEAGDISRPIWSGCWWSANSLPKNERGAMASPSLKIIRTEEGMMVSLDDDGQTITLSDENGRNMLQVKVQAGVIYIKGASKAVVEAPQIELVENATHPVVFGDELMNYLNQIVQLYNAHLHPGETLAGIPITPAPPQPMFLPPTPILISQRVKSG
jgi:hypothetical protein